MFDSRFAPCSSGAETDAALDPGALSGRGLGAVLIVDFTALTGGGGGSGLAAKIVGHVLCFLFFMSSFLVRAGNAWCSNLNSYG